MMPPQDKSALTLSLQHLKAHGLDPQKGQVLDNLTFILPPLEAPALDSHIYAIGSKLPHLPLPGGMFHFEREIREDSIYDLRPDEVRYLVNEEHKYRATLALHIAKLWTRGVYSTID